MDFGYQNRAKVAPRWDQKSMLTLKAENQLNASRLAFSLLSGVEVWSKNRLKIDPKMESKMECILASILNRFWSIFGTKLGWKINPKSCTHGIEKTIEKRRPARWPTRRSKSLRRRVPPPDRAQGEGVGGEVNLSPESENNITTKTPC